MNEEVIAEIRNKITVPKTALEKLSKGEKVSEVFLELALKELNTLGELLEKIYSSEAKLPTKNSS